MGRSGGPLNHIMMWEEGDGFATLNKDEINQRPGVALKYGN